MNRAPARLLPPSVVALIGLASGCGDPSSLQTAPTSIVATPDSVLDPRPPAMAPAAQSKAAPADSAVTPATAAAAAPAAGKVALVPMTYDQYKAKAVVHPEAKLTIVDAWATWCSSCVENFPHVVQMHRKYADKGLAVVSLSLDDASDPKAVAGATAFLKAQGADFLNVVLAEEQGDAFDKLDLIGIPAVLLYDPTGKEIRRFTGDDVNRPFTYEEVEDVVAKLLRGETLPADAPGEVRAARK